MTDPNIRHVLAAIRHSFPDTPPHSFLIAKTPDRSEFETEDEFDARLIRHRYWAQDLERYGFEVVDVPTYDTIDSLLLQLERRVARRRVWISGSWPEAHAAFASEPIASLAQSCGHLVADRGLSLVTGSGLTVGPASLRGFLDGLQRTGSWDLERRLIVRPFPQPSAGEPPNLRQWQQLREEMARISGTMIVIGGLKIDASGSAVTADGVIDEFKRALAHQCYIVPIGSTGGAAADISKSLIGSDIPVRGPDAQRPSDEVLGTKKSLGVIQSTPHKTTLIPSLRTVPQKIRQCKCSRIVPLLVSGMNVVQAYDYGRRPRSLRSLATH